MIYRTFVPFLENCCSGENGIIHFNISPQYSLGRTTMRPTILIKIELSNYVAKAAFYFSWTILASIYFYLVYVYWIKCRHIRFSFQKLSHRLGIWFAYVFTCLRNPLESFKWSRPTEKGQVFGVWPCVKNKKGFDQKAPTKTKTFVATSGRSYWSSFCISSWKW